MPRDKKTKAQDAPLLNAGRIEAVPFALLETSPLNARKHGAEVAADDELVASIRTQGLLQPLIGYYRDGMDADAGVLIAAGQRRLNALRHIASPETEIPVRIVDEETAIEVSLAENLERKDMNPADELDAFNALIETGHYDANRIADRFGYDRRYVRRRLKMAVLHGDILAALREGAIGVSSAEAYAASDDQDLQIRVFKAQSKPNAWNAHAPASILREYSAAGVDPQSGVGKFIGGADAYVAEGGTIERDEAFADLFDEHVGDAAKLTDPAIVLRLYERACAAAQPQVEEAVKAETPFATGIEWSDASGKPPKPAKGLVPIREGWDGDSGKYLHEADVRAIAEKVADAGGTVIVPVRIDGDGQPRAIGGCFHVGKDALDQVLPKKAKASADPYRAPTPEERAAAEREREITTFAAKLFVASLTDEQLGARCRKAGRLWGYDGKGSFEARIEILADEIAGLRAQAEELVDREGKAAEEQRAAVAKMLDHLASSPIAKWPAVVSIKGEDFELTIRRGEQDGAPVLELESDEGDSWQGFDPAETIEIIRDQIEDMAVTLHMHESVEAFDRGVANAEAA